MPIVVVLGVVIKEVPILLVSDVKEFYCCPGVVGCVQEVISSVWIEFVRWCVEGDCVFNVAWEVVVPPSVNKLGVFGKFPYDELSCQSVCVFASTIFEASRKA